MFFSSDSDFLLKRFKFCPQKLRINRFNTFGDPVFTVSRMIANRLKLLHKKYTESLIVVKTLAKSACLLQNDITMYSLTAVYERLDRPTSKLDPKSACKWGIKIQNVKI